MVKVTYAQQHLILSVTRHTDCTENIRNCLKVRPVQSFCVRSQTVGQAASNRKFISLVRWMRAAAVDWAMAKTRAAVHSPRDRRLIFCASYISPMGGESRAVFVCVWFIGPFAAVRHRDNRTLPLLLPLLLQIRSSIYHQIFLLSK